MSTIAVVADDAVAIESLVPCIIRLWQHQRRLQRALDRSRRATNPGNDHSNGTSKKGCHTWNKSECYLGLQRQIAEVEGQMAATRKKEHGELANKILGLGSLIQTETLSYKAFQKGTAAASKSVRREDSSIGCPARLRAPAASSWN